MLLLMHTMKIKFLLVLLVIAAFSVAPVKALDYGTSPDPVKPWEGLPICYEVKPKPPILYEPNNPAIQRAKNPGEIRLQWTKVPQATGYNIYFGLSPRNYIYSASVDGRDTDNYTVRFLGNRTYYFAVQSKTGCAAGILSNEWLGRPGGGGTAIVRTAAFVPVQREAVVEDNAQPQAPRLVPSIPIVPPAPRPAAPQSGGFFQAISSFFGRLFGR